MAGISLYFNVLLITGEEAAATGGGKQLLVEQVRILDNEGSMKVVYPARNDLQAEGYKVIRNYE